MNLYHLDRTDTVNYDEATEMVVAAKSASRARKIASENRVDEPASTWLDSETSTARIIGTAKTTVPEGVVIRAVNWG